MVILMCSLRGGSKPFFFHVLIIAQFTIVSDSTKRDTDRTMDQHYWSQ